MLHCPIAISGFVRGLEKDSMQTSPDIEILHNSHVTVYLIRNDHCRMWVADLMLCVMFILLYLSSLPMRLVLSLQVVSILLLSITVFCNDLLIVSSYRKVKSNITTYSFSELATLLLNNEQVGILILILFRCIIHPLTWLVFISRTLHALPK